MNIKEGLERTLPDQKENSAPSKKTPLPDNVTSPNSFSQVGKYWKSLALTLAAAGLTILSFTEQQPTNVGASPKDTPTPTPSSSLYSAEGLPSQKDIKQLARQLLEGEVIQTHPGHLEFNIDGDHYIWDVSNASFGIYPPNNPDIRTGTVRVTINGTPRYDKVFQGLQSSAPHQPLMAQAIGGIAVSLSCDSYFLGGSTLRGDGNYDSYLEKGRDVRYPERYLDRAVIWKGLPKNGTIGHWTPVILGTNSSGNYANYVFTDTDTVDSTESGTYQIPLDSQCDYIGDTFSKLPEVLPSSTATATATSTATTQPTPETTSVVVEPTPGNSYTAILSSNLAGLIVPAEAAGSSSIKAEVRQAAIPSDLPSAILPLNAIEISFSRTDGTRITELATDATISFAYEGYNLTEQQLGTLVVYNADRKQYLRPRIDRIKKEVSIRTRLFSILALARAIAPIPTTYLPASLKFFQSQ